jgi:hypothetical protein
MVMHLRFWPASSIRVIHRQSSEVSFLEEFWRWVIGFSLRVTAKTQTLMMVSGITSTEIVLERMKNMAERLRRWFRFTLFLVKPVGETTQAADYFPQYIKIQGHA